MGVTLLEIPAYIILGLKETPVVPVSYCEKLSQLVKIKLFLNFFFMVLA